MDNIIDLSAYRESKKRVEELISAADVTKLSHGELACLVAQIGKLIHQQSELLNAILVDMGLLVQRFQEMQQQFIYVSGQAYLAVTTLKEKEIASPEEIETAWQKIVQEKILKPQGLAETSSPEDQLVDSPAASTTEPKQVD